MRPAELAHARAILDVIRRAPKRRAAFVAAAPQCAQRTAQFRTPRNSGSAQACSVDADLKQRATRAAHGKAPLLPRVQIAFERLQGPQRLAPRCVIVRQLFSIAVAEGSVIVDVEEVSRHYDDPRRRIGRYHSYRSCSRRGSMARFSVRLRTKPWGSLCYSFRPRQWAPWAVKICYSRVRWLVERTSSNERLAPRGVVGATPTSAPSCAKVPA
ncbi:hypothetical protein ACVWWL_000095 [Bradyrhizobium sp. USDA 3696]|jgi:hypothetical protein